MPTCTHTGSAQCNSICISAEATEHGIPAADLLRGQVLHASGDLVGAGHQVFEGELLVGDFTGVEGVVHARWPPRPQVLPQVAFRGVFHQDVQRTCVQQSHFQNIVTELCFCCLAVCLQGYGKTTFHESLWKGVACANEEPIKLWSGSGSDSLNISRHI